MATEVCKVCLNPCFNGRWSASKPIFIMLITSLQSLNPCFNGRWSARILSYRGLELNEKSLNPCFNGRWSASFVTLLHISKDGNVLILVLMEDGLRAFSFSVTECFMHSS